MSERSPVSGETPDADEYWIKRQDGDKRLEDEYLMGDIIGRGTSSVVYKCLRKGRTEWACKVFKKTRLDKRAVQMRIGTLLKLKHPNIVQLKEVFETPDEIQIISELALGEELFERIVERGHYSEEDAAKAVKQILNALQYLHSHGIVHGGLKPENLFYETDSEDSVLKVADFGMRNLLARCGTLPSIGGCTNLGYSAPEVVQSKAPTSASDLWSLGVITYILLCGFEPFWDEAGETAMLQRITSGDYSFLSPWWDEVSESGKELVSKLLVLDPESRLTAEEALYHPWTQGINTPNQHLNKTFLRLKEFNAKRKFRVATKAVIATCRALSFLSPSKNADDKTDSCLHETSTDGRTKTSEPGEESRVREYYDCSPTDGRVRRDSGAEDSFSSLTIDGGNNGKTSTMLEKEVSSQYKGTFVGLG